MRRRIVVALVLVLVASILVGGYAVAGTKDNDKTLYGTDRVQLQFKGGYQEVFKKDSHGSSDKNYLYTVTSFVDAFGRQCTVTSGDSEQTIALDCDYKPTG